MRDRIEEVLRTVGGLGADPGELGADDDLYAAGMTSFASVNVMLALEDEFAIEFPDRMLNRTVFSTIGNLEGAVAELLGDAVGADAR